MKLDYLFPLIGVLASLLWAYLSFRYYLHYSGLNYRGVGKQERNRRMIWIAIVSLVAASLAFTGLLVSLFNLAGTPRQPPISITITPGQAASQPSPTPSLFSLPVQTSTPESSPTPESVPGSGFARIGNTSGFGANVRSEPGLAFAVLTQLSDGIRVELTGEAQSADGFTWQRVRLENGQLGWIVDTFLIPEP
jgi:hypothetical protein